MSPVLDTTPLGTQAGILDRVLHAAHPRIELPTIAHHFSMTLVELQTILKAHGYPDKDRMRLAMSKLRIDAAEAIDPRQAPDAPKATEPADGRLTRIPLEQLHADPDNARENLTDIEELAESINSIGMLQPIIARRHGERLIVVAGHRRLAAVRHLRWTDAPVIVRAEMRPDDVLAAMLIENGQRVDLDPIEEARALNRLKHNLGISEAELGRRIGRNPNHVAGRLMLLSLSIEEQEALRAGISTLTAAKEKARIESGRVRPKAIGRKPPAHLSAGHPLAERVQVRCVQLKHSRGKGMGVGGVACGECWEAVIRADERERTHAASAAAGRCLTCGVDHEPASQKAVV